jgi:carbon monoxide dehydrogenase subunit G
VQLEHSFSVPVGIGEAWRLLLDIERIAPCIPGATIDAVDGEEITGAIKVRLGTIGPTYKGSATVAERDPEGHRAIINAHGESRSSGSATARIIATLSEFGGSTSVMLMTEIEFTGKPGQLEQAVISDAGARVVRQFAERLAALLAEQVSADAAGTEPEQPAAEAPAAAPPAAAPPAAEAPVEGQSLTTPPVSQDAPVADGVAATPARRPSPRPRPSADVPEPAKSIPSAPVAPSASAAASARAAAPTPAPVSDHTRPRHANSARPHVEVIPAEPAEGLQLLLKRAAPFAILVIILLLRRRRRRRR